MQPPTLAVVLRGRRDDAIVRAGDDVQVRKVPLHRLGNLEGALAVVDGDHEHLRVLCARGFEQIEPSRIAVVHAKAELA